MGEISQADSTGPRGAEGETPGRRGKLSGKRTVTPRILWRESFVRPPKGKASSLWAKGNLSGKRTGEPRDNPKAPLFFGMHYHGPGIGALPNGAIT